MKVGYYEIWNYNHPCLNLRVADVGVNEYTYIYWVFAEITEDFDIKINDNYNQWKDFIGLLNVNNILSFGGWGYSISPVTYDVLRKAMDLADSGKFIDNINDFV